MADPNTATRIVEAAGPIFAEKGFAKATVRDICEAAGVNLAAVNYHFGDKQQLYIETVKRARQRRAEQVPLPEWSADTPAEVKLRQFIATMMRRILGADPNAWEVRLMMREVLQPSQACQELVRDYFQPHFRILLGILDELLPADMPLYQRHQIGFSIIGQCVYYRMAGQVVEWMVGPEEVRQHYGIDQLAEHVIRMTLAALGLAPPLRESAPAAEQSSQQTG